MDRAPIDHATDAVMKALAGAQAVGPIGLLLLVREYESTGRIDIAEALGPALGRALMVCDTEPEHQVRARWIQLFLESSSVSADERLQATAERLALDLAREWPSEGPVALAMEAIDACLAVTTVADGTDLLPRAIDELERVIGLTYAPGQGVSAVLGRGERPGQLVDHVTSAAVLLNAYSATGRLPYSMLAEELMQVARRRWWSAGYFVDTGLTNGSAFTSNCDAARVLCRISTLHANDAYRQAAVVASAADYAADAGSILGAIVPSSPFDEDAATYAVALGEYLMLKR